MKKNNFNVVFVVLTITFATIFYVSKKNPHKTNRSVSSVEQCPREAVGGDLKDADDLFAKNGVLDVNLEYKSYKVGDDYQFCFLMENGHQSPTMHVRPGDHLRIHVKNSTEKNQKLTKENAFRIDLPSGKNCAAPYIDASSMNIHFHGTNTPPTCGSDEVINTVINAGETYVYDLPVPQDEPPGAYFYHPHIHGKAQEAAWGGATGIIIVEGLQNYFPELVGLNDRILTVRDNQGLSEGEIEKMGIKAQIEASKDSEVPSFEVSLNYHPIPFPNYIAPTVKVAPETKELWRVSNTSADAILNIRVDYDGQTQPMTIYAIDAVPTGTFGGIAKAKPIVKNNWILGPGNRVEFVIKTPGVNVKSAKLMTDKYDTGADVDPSRPLLNLQATKEAPVHSLKIGEAFDKPARVHRFANMLREIKSKLFSKKRKLYFSQKDIQDPDDATQETTEFYLTVEGKKDEAFNMKRPIDIITRQNAIEEWVIENRADEAHVFHIHQIHFLLLEKNGHKVDDEDKQSYDTIVLPKYDGAKDKKGRPIYPSVKLRMDFSGTKPGTFVYHCHILEHEDKGMMGIIQVLPESEPEFPGED